MSIADAVLRVPGRSLVVLAGLPGAGKTTTLRRVTPSLPGDVVALDAEDVAAALRHAPVPYAALRPVVHAGHLARVVRATTGPAASVLATDPLSSPLRRLLLHCAARCTGRSLDVVLVDATVEQALAGQVERGRTLGPRRMRRHVRRWRRLRRRPSLPLVASWASLSRAEAAAVSHVEVAAGAASPAAPVHHVVEGPPVGSRDRAQGPVRGVPEADHVDAQVPVRQTEHPPRPVLVADRRVPRADAQVDRREHHHGCQLPDDGARRPASRTRSRSSRGIGRPV